MLKKTAFFIAAAVLFISAVLWSNTYAPAEGFFAEAGDKPEEVKVGKYDVIHEGPDDYRVYHSYVPEVYRGKIENEAVTEVVLLQNFDMILYTEYALDYCVPSGSYCYLVPAYTLLGQDYFKNNFSLYDVPQHDVTCEPRGTVVEMSNEEFENHKAIGPYGEVGEGAFEWAKDYEFDHADMDVLPTPDDSDLEPDEDYVEPVDEAVNEVDVIVDNQPDIDVMTDPDIDKLVTDELTTSDNEPDSTGTDVQVVPDDAKKSGGGCALVTL